MLVRMMSFASVALVSCIGLVVACMLLRRKQRREEEQMALREAETLQEAQDACNVMEVMQAIDRERRAVKGKELAEERAKRLEAELLLGRECGAVRSVKLGF